MISAMILTDNSVVAGQGSLPEIPVPDLPCEKCGMQMRLIDKCLPEICPHCGYQVRPATDSMWNNFLFVLRNRYFTWRGRATRKEFWSYSFFSTLIMLLVLFLESIITYIGMSLILVYFIIPHIFLIARRLHDIGFSGLWVKIYWILVAVLILLMFATYLYVEFGHDYSAVEEGDFVLSHSDSVVLVMLLLATLINFAVETIRIFFLVVSFINSNKGTNQFEPSRKYPLGIHV